VKDGFALVLRKLSEDLSDVNGAQLGEQVYGVRHGPAANEPTDRIQH
jgi:hypothetical protein